MAGDSVARDDIGRRRSFRRDLVDRAGGLLSRDAVAALLGADNRSIDRRRRDGKLLAIRSDRWRYPARQFDGGGTIVGVEDVLAAFSTSSPWIALDFLLSPDSVLSGLSPRDALLKGGDHLELVRALTRGNRKGDGFA